MQKVFHSFAESFRLKGQVQLMVGMFAISRAGHDKDRVYIIIKEEGDFVYLADGKARGLKNPKKKKKKHLQLMKTDIDTTWQKS